MATITNADRECSIYGNKLNQALYDLDRAMSEAKKNRDKWKGASMASLLDRRITVVENFIKNGKYF